MSAVADTEFWQIRDLGDQVRWRCIGCRRSWTFEYEVDRDGFKKTPVDGLLGTTFTGPPVGIAVSERL